MLLIPENHLSDIKKEVFVAKTGKVFHKRSCKKIKYGYSLSLEEALNKGYKICSYCGGYNTTREEKAKEIGEGIRAIYIYLSL